MANRLKRLQLEAERLREAEKFAAALRRKDRTPTVSRIRKRRPERSSAVFDLRLKVFEYWDQTGVREMGGFTTPESLADHLFSVRPLLRALIQHPNYLGNLLTLYNRMRPCRPTVQWRPPKSMLPYRVLESYIVHHFVQYQWSRPLMAAWMELPNMPSLLEPFIHMASGKRFRNMPYLPSGFTSKMAHFLLHAPRDLSWEEAISWAFLHGLGFPASKVRTMSDLEQWAFITNGAHLHLWHFLLRHPEIRPADVRRIITFYAHQSAGKVSVASLVHTMNVEVDALYPQFHFQGATPASVLRRVEAWEAHLHAIRNAPYTGELPAAGVQGLEYDPANGQLPVVIRQIRQPIDLLREGRAMQHCVATYLEECVNGSCSIWAVRQADNRLATIELRPDKKIYQVKGKYNRQPDELVREAVVAWSRQEALLVLRY